MGREEGHVNPSRASSPSPLSLALVSILEKGRKPAQGANAGLNALLSMGRVLVLGVMPVPKFQTLYVQRVGISELPSIRELGRLHFTSGELTRLEQAQRQRERLLGLQEKEDKKRMAFELIDYSALPVREFGRSATEPKVSISEAGRIGFNVFINKSWEDVVKVLIRYDPETRMLLFNGCKEGQTFKNIKPESLFKLAKSKERKDDKGITVADEGESISIGGAAMLGKIGYKYAEAGNQSFNSTWDEKLKGYVVVLPATTPTRKPVVARKKKVSAPVNGAVAPPPPPAENDLIEI